MRIKTPWLSLVVLVWFMTACIVSPEADFSMDQQEAEAPATISFTNLSSDASRYLWDFGDNTASDELSPSHVYLAAGEYTVRLTVKGKGGTDEIQKQVMITPSQVANNQGTTYRFKNSSIYTLYNTYTYFWDTEREQVLDINSHGTMGPEIATSQIATTRNRIYVSFYNADQTVFYTVNPAYTINQNTDNLLEFTNNTDYLTEDVQQENSSTTYRVYNNSSFRLMEATTYYWNNNQFYDLYEHGNLDIGSSTDVKSTSYEYVYIGFYNANYTHYFIVNPPFQLTAGVHNDIEVNDQTEIYYEQVSATDTTIIFKSITHYKMHLTTKSKPPTSQFGNVKQ